jgi:hypothetical protein
MLRDGRRFAAGLLSMRLINDLILRSGPQGRGSKDGNIRQGDIP